MSDPNKHRLSSKIKNFGEGDVGKLKGVNYRGFLPHFNLSYRYQVITYRLNDSLPENVLKKLKENCLENTNLRKRIEELIDAGKGSCVLKEPKVGSMVVENWKFFHEKKYELVSYVVMPNHVHVLIKQFKDYSLAEIVHSWKSFTSNQFSIILKELGLSNIDHAGSPIRWQREYWDRYIRDEHHFISAIDYIHNNPVKAGLCAAADEWPFSSFIAFNNQK